MADNALKPRLCHVKKRADFNGYGFNLHAEKGKAGQFIGKVDPGSPAERAGLKEGDRIVEINGTNINNENHQQVVTRVKAVPDETSMLVVDSEADKYHKENSITIRGDMPTVIKLSSESENLPNGTGSRQRSDSLPDDAPAPRRCQLKIWPDFQGYGFNLHAEKGKPGQFIGKVDDDSPASMAGLKEGDRIVEVNDDNIGQATHKDVVTRIKANPNETTMLVVDAETEKYYSERDITVAHTLPSVVTITCPDTKSSAPINGSAEIQAEVVNHVDANQEEEKRSRNSSHSEPEVEKDDKGEQNNNIDDEAENYDVIANVPPPKSDSEEEADGNEPELPERTATPEPEERVPTPEPVRDPSPEPIRRDPSPEPVRDPSPEPVRDPSPEPVRDPSPEPAARSRDSSPEPEVKPPVYENAVAMPEVETKKEEPKAPEPTPQSPTKGPVVVGGIEFAGSAREARERMSKKRRDQVKQQNISAKDKYDLLMKM